MDTTEEKVDLRDVINEKMNSEGRTFKWLERSTGIVYATLYACIVSKNFNLSQENLSKINEALGTAYTLDAE